MTDLMAAALIRVKRTALEYILASVPAGFVITPAMLQHFDAKVAGYAFLAWFLTGLLNCGLAFAAAYYTGLPETQGLDALEGDDDEDEEDEDDDGDDAEE